jgi:hypothetical protein
MIKDRALSEAWEAQYIASEPPDFRLNLRIFAAMYEYVWSPGRFPPTGSLDELESRIKLARVLNGRNPSGKDSLVRSPTKASGTAENDEGFAD